MSDFNTQNGYNSNYQPAPPQAPPVPNGYNPQRQYPNAPYIPAQPGQAPPFSSPQAPPMPTPQPAYAPEQPEREPANTPAEQPGQRPPYTPPVQPEHRPPFNPPPAPSYVPPQAPAFDRGAPYGAAQPSYSSENNYTYRQAPAAPKQPMSAGLKALIITLSVLLVGTLTALIAVVASNSSAQKQQSKSDFGFETPTVPQKENPGSYYDYGEKETTPPAENYKQSDAKDKTDKNYAGLKLGKKPSSGKSGTAAAFNKVKDSVVGVICYVDGQDGTSTSYSVMGTGIVVSADGYIITNAHIINNSRTAYLIKIITDDKKEYDAGVVGYDSRSDVAVLKVDAKGLKPAAFGDSDDIEITEDVIIVGNPLSLDYQNSVTGGIVSAVDRHVSISNNVGYIQTDAAINPGNSGGPMCNMYGQVIGIATSKIALDDYEGMGFAIPSKRIKQVVDDVIRYGYVQNRVKIGVTGEVKYISEGRGTAIQIMEITEDGPMDGTGAKLGDYIIGVDGEKVRNFADIYSILEKHKVGEKVKVTVYRQSNDKEYDFDVKLQADEP